MIMQICKCLLSNCSHTDSYPSPVLLWGTNAEALNISQQPVTQYSAHGPEREDTQFSLSNMFHVFFLLWPLNGPWRSTQINAPCWREQSAFKPFVFSEFLMNSSNATIQRGDFAIYVHIIDLGTKPCLHQANDCASGFSKRACTLFMMRNPHRKSIGFLFWTVLSLLSQLYCWAMRPISWGVVE